MSKKNQSQDFIKTGKRVINREARALDKLEKRKNGLQRLDPEVGRLYNW